MFLSDGIIFKGRRRVRGYGGVFLKLRNKETVCHKSKAEQEKRSTKKELFDCSDCRKTFPALVRLEPSLTAGPLPFNKKTALR
jgi:hypothetical protein